MRDDETTIKGNFATVIVRNDHGENPAYNRGQLYLELEGGKFTGLGADELRDAIDKAVGPREADMLLRDQASIYCEVAVHPVFDECWTFDNPSAEAMIEKLDELSGSDSAPAKPYRPVDRDRHLRHIEDIEATLARRNERHEQDQERIRELEGIAMRRGDRIDELEAKLEGEVATPSAEEQLEALKKVPAGYEAVLDPPRLLDTPSARAGCIPATMVKRITTRADGMGGLDFLLDDAESFCWYGLAQQALELGVTAEDFGPSIETRRKEYEEQGLAEWEIELLLSHNRS